MKQLKCEMCGGTDLIKEDSVFVCQSCGVKYSLEEAKKMMVEGTVNVQGVVKIDVSDTIKERVSTWRRIADDAFDNTNYDEAYTYYCKIVEQQVDDWFATYRKSACVAWKANLAHMRANEMAGGLVNASELLYADDEMTDSDKADGIILMVAEVYDWIQAFMRVVNEHCQKFVGEMVSAAIEYYQREIILSELMMLIMDMLTEYVYQNCTDKKYFSKLLENLYTTGMNLNSNLCATFKVKTGSRWVGSGYMDEYEVVEPDYKAISTSNKISSAIYKTKKNLFAWQEAEKKRRNAAIKESVLEKHKNTEAKKLIPLAADYLKDHRYVEAEAAFELIIEKAPAERVGYLGKAAAIKGNDGLFDQIFEWVIKARDKNVSDEYQLITKRVLNEKIGTSDDTLLMSACFRQELNVVNILIEMGADVHVQTKYHTTALWHICNKALPKDKELEGREIARILLEHGASVEVVNTGNIPLLNKDTDVDIKRMIKEKHPHASYFLRQAKQRKIITITALALVAVILLIILISSLVKNGQRENYMANGEYGEVVKMDNLTEFIIPEGVTIIENNTFEDCKNLTSITIPASVTKIGKDAFSGCWNLTNVYITDIAAWCNIDFEAYSLSAEKLYLNNELVTKLVIPETVTQISARAFRGCRSLTEVILPDSITSIGEDAFCGCIYLRKIVISKNVTYVGSEAFYNCRNLKIYCEAQSRPSGWSSIWNNTKCPVVWGYKEN